MLLRTVYAVRKALRKNYDEFTKWVSCPSGSALYHVQECVWFIFLMDPKL